MLQNYSKKLMRLAAILTIGIVQAQVNTFPFFEGFEDNSPTRTAWTQIYETNNMSWDFSASPSTGSHLNGSTGPYEGSKMANYPATSHLFDKTKLVSPVLDLSNASAATLQFYYRNPFWSPDQNWLRIFYRTSATSEWNLIQTYHSDIVSWTSSGVLNLPNPSATYQIAIECETDYGYSTTVDALTINITPLSVREQNEIVVHFYPNPVKDVLTFTSTENLEKVSIYNLFGQKVLEQKISQNQGQVSLGHLAQGQYVIKAENANGLKSFKFLKQ